MRRSIVVLVAASLLTGCARGPGGEPLRDAAELAAAESGVPADLLLATGWTSSGLTMRDGAGGRIGLMGIPDSVLEADHPARSRLRENVMAGALRLAAFGEEERSPPLDSPASWRPALRRWSALGDPGLDDAWADAVLDVLRFGLEVTILGERVSIPPQQLGADTLSSVSSAMTAGSPVAFVPAHPANWTPGRFGAPDCIVVHVVQGSYWGAISWFQNPAAAVSAHYVVRSADGEITQTLAEWDTAWHAGNWLYNDDCIGIEHEGWVSDPAWFTEESYRSSALLVRDIATRWGIPLDRQHVFGHVEVPNQVSFHSDPGPHWDWGRYMDLVTGDEHELEASFVGQAASTFTPTVGEPFTFSFTLKNDGVLAWSDDGSDAPGRSVRLGFTGGESFAVPPRVSVSSASTAHVAPGGAVTFTLSGKAPTQPGRYRSHWRLVSEAVAWFGPDLWLEFDVLPATGLAAEFVGQTFAKSDVRPGAPVDFTFTLKNSGTKPWRDTGALLEAQSVRLGHIGGERFSIASRVSIGAATDTWVMPGETTTFPMHGIAPSIPGVWRTRWRPVSEGVAWFGPELWLDFTVLDVPGLAAEFRGQGASTFSPPRGQPFTFWFTVENTGSNSWVDWEILEEGRAVRLGHIAGPAFGLPERISLDFATRTDVHPEETTTFVLHGVAPATPGKYRTTWRLVSEAVAWYGPEMWLEFDVQ